MPPPTLAPTVDASAPPPVACSVPIKPEAPQGYPGDPSPIHTPMRQDVTALELRALGNGRYDVGLGQGESTPALRDVDMRPFIPRVPALARGNATLTRIALVQREPNRNETTYGKAAGADDVKVANNCLRQGLWEVILSRRGEAGLAAEYHGWFDFPKQEYARLFEEVNGLRYADYQKLLDAYPEIGGFPVPLDALRTVVRELPAEPSISHAREPVLRFPEQVRKANLVLSKHITTYADFTSPSRQPILTARFSEPGFYNAKDPMRFDLAWLAKPTTLRFRQVRSAKVAEPFDEIEVAFANGNRLLLADAELARLAARHAAPTTEAEVLRVTFGIGTPDIYSSAPDRAREFSADRPSYLMLIDPQGKHVDNHAAGLDRVYLWRGDGQPGAIHLYLVGYERIAIVGHISAPWARDSSAR